MSPLQLWTLFHSKFALYSRIVCFMFRFWCVSQTTLDDLSPFDRRLLILRTSVCPALLRVPVKNFSVEKSTAAKTQFVLCFVSRVQNKRLGSCVSQTTLDDLSPFDRRLLILRTSVCPALLGVPVKNFSTEKSTAAKTQLTPNLWSAQQRKGCPVRF